MRTIINSENVRVQELSPFQVQSRREIVALLRSLEQQRQLITMLASGGPEAVVTSILEVDDENNLLYIDCAPSSTMNRRLAESDNISFETVLDHIRILFFAAQLAECEHDGKPALSLPIPASLIRLQRREFYRVQTPITTPVRCTIQISNEQGSETVTVALQNVSGGGIAIVDDKKILDDTVGLVYKDCRIHLPGNTTVVTSLQVRNTTEVSMLNGKTIRRIGCLFIELPAPMLAAIQRYITKLEREQNAKTNGLLNK